MRKREEDIFTPCNTKKEVKKASKHTGILFLVVLTVLISGFIGTFLICVLMKQKFSMLMWPLILTIDVFVFTTIGFFNTEGHTEITYGALSLLSVAGIIAQLIVVF